MPNPIAPLQHSSQALSSGASALLAAICREMVFKPSQHVLTHNQEMATRAGIDVKHIRTYQHELQAANLMVVTFDEREGFTIGAQRTSYRLVTLRNPKARRNEQ